MASGDVTPFHRFARLYDLCMYAADREGLREALGAADRPVERVLDAAGGSGRASRALEEPETVVVDAARGMVRQARSHGLGAILGDATALPIRDESVDAVLIVDALHHVVGVDDALVEARRVLRPGGVLVLREFDPTTLRGRALVAGEHLVGFDSTFLPPDRLRERVAAAGLEASVRERGFGYTVVGVRPGG